MPGYVSAKVRAKVARPQACDKQVPRILAGGVEVFAPPSYRTDSRLH